MLAFQLNIPEIFSEALASPANMVATPMTLVSGICYVPTKYTICLLEFWLGVSLLCKYQSILCLLLSKYSNTLMVLLQIARGPAYHNFEHNKWVPKRIKHYASILHRITV